MRKVILLSTVLFATPLGIESYAADCATTSCQTLGYTATSNKGNCLQCPFGNYWFCPESQCDSSYKYTCTGYMQSPSGTACNGKYRKCNCSNNYVWNASQGLCLAGSGSGSGSGSGGSSSSGGSSGGCMTPIAGSATCNVSYSIGSSGDSRYPYKITRSASCSCSNGSNSWNESYTAASCADYESCANQLSRYSSGTQTVSTGRCGVYCAETGEAL